MNKLHYDIGFGWGVAACKRKEPRVPAANKRVMDFIAENCKEVGSSISILKGFNKGYEWQLDQECKAILAGFDIA